MPVKLYKLDPSPPARATMIACELLNVPNEMIDVNLLEQEHKSPEFLKKNPLHTVPVLEDGSLTIADSHAILMYLADTYGKNDSLYPKDVKQRALVNEKLFFDTAVLFGRLRNVTFPAIMRGEREVAPQLLKDIEEAYEFLEEFLSRNKYIATNNLTIADVAAFATVSSLEYLVSLDTKKYPKIAAWLKNLEQQPAFQKQNAPGLKAFAGMVKHFVDL